MRFPSARSTTFRFASAAVVTAGLLSLFPAESRAARRTAGILLMTSFLQNGRTDVRRNEILVLKFSMPLRKGSVDSRTFRVLENTGSGVQPAIGARIVRGNVLRFDPSRTQVNYDESRKPNDTEHQEKDHVVGFAGFQDYTVELPALPEPHTLRNTSGDKLRQGFGGSFRTGSLYDDPAPGQPFFIGDHGTGLLGFEPARSGATGLVDVDAVIVLEFSEPVQMDTLDPSNTVSVLRYTVGEQVPGYIKLDSSAPSGRRYIFVPSVGFGSDKVNEQGWDIQVSLTTGILDLAGNPLKRPVTFPIFRTRYVADLPSCSLVTESFNNTAKRDPVTISKGGEWNTIERGVLRGGFPTVYPNRDIQITQENTPDVTVVRGNVVAEPLVAKEIPATNGGGCSARPTGSRVQMMYLPTDVGIAGAVVGVGWGPSSNALFAATYPEVILRMGHTSVTSLGSGSFEANINVGSPQLLYRGPYSVPQAKNISPPGLTNGYWEWPIASVFEYNGQDQLVFDAAVAPGNNCQLLRKADVPIYPNRRALNIDYTSPQPLVAEPVIYDIRLRKRRRTTEAISLWYEVAADNPIFATPIVSPSAQSAGVGILLEMEGAHGKPDPFNIGQFIADPTTGTGWTTNPSVIDGHRFFRFRFSMFANLTTNQTARVTSVQFPYCF